MVNPENRLTTRIFINKDGKPIKMATNKGLKDTPEERKLKSERMRGVPKKREAVESWSTVWKIIKPLYARGALRVDIVEITGLKKSQVDNAIANNDKRPEWNQVMPFAILGESNAKTRARRRRELRKNGISEDEVKSIQFARLLLGGGFIKEDISGWEELHEFYQRHGKLLPDNVAKKLRLEFFLRARRLAQQQDTSLLAIYNNLGQQVDPAWFDMSLAGNENFIMHMLDNGVIFNQDKLGFFRFDGHGLWRRPQGIGEHGGIIFDNPNDAKRREENREMVAAGANVRGYTQETSIRPLHNSFPVASLRARGVLNSI